jgi:hypothetical protein
LEEKTMAVEGPAAAADTVGAVAGAAVGEVGAGEYAIAGTYAHNRRLGGLERRFLLLK